MALEGPATTPNARLAADRLDLDTLSQDPTPDVALSVTSEAVLTALPSFDSAEISVGQAGGYQRMAVQLANSETGMIANAMIRRIPPEEQGMAIRMEFALFSAPLQDLQRYDDPELDRLGALANSDDYAVAVKGSFVTTARGANATMVAATLTKLLFDGN
ncbi:MAG: hypothetical protein AAFV09_11280 [Pseudomonadota bacterium]